MINLAETYITPPERGWLATDDTGYAGEKLYTSIWFDPGGTTGWSIFGVYTEAMRIDDYRILDNIAFWSAGEFTGRETSQVDQMVDLVMAWPTARVGGEDFILRKFSAGRELLAPVRVWARFEGGLHEALGRDPRPLMLQQPALAMTTVTDQRLKDIGAWLPGQPHGRDATKHNLTWLRQHKRVLRIEVPK